MAKPVETSAGDKAPAFGASRTRSSRRSGSRTRVVAPALRLNRREVPKSYSDTALLSPTTEDLGTKRRCKGSLGEQGQGRSANGAAWSPRRYYACCWALRMAWCGDCHRNPCCSSGEEWGVRSVRRVYGGTRTSGL